MKVFDKAAGIVGVVVVAVMVGGAAPSQITLNADLSFGGDELYFPSCISDGLGSIVVVDSQNNRLVEFNRSGEIVNIMGSIGSLEGELLYPNEVDIDSSGRMLISDTANLRVQLWKLGSTETVNYPLNYNAYSVAWMDSSRWVVDSNSWKSGYILDVYNVGGEKLYSIGQAFEVDNKWISIPAGVNKTVISAEDGRIAVGLQTQARVLVYSYEGETLADFRVTHPVVNKMREWWWGSCRDRSLARRRMKESIDDPLTLVNDVAEWANEKDANCMFYISQIEIYGDELWVMLGGNIYVYDFNGNLIRVYYMRSECGNEVALHYFSRDDEGFVWGVDTMHTHECYRFSVGK